MGQYGQKLPEERAESEGRQLRIRSGLLILFFLAALGGYVYVLYGLQIVQGDSFRVQASYTTSKQETVDSVRGDLLDSCGRVLVTNTQSYQVTLDPSVMGERKNEILTALLALCREEGITWTDTFPVSPEPPYAFTKPDVYTYINTRTETNDWGATSEVTETRRTNLGALAVACRWIDDPLAENPKPGGVFYLTAPELMVKMCGTYGIELPEAPEGQLPEIDTDTRALLGVLYELALRQREITYADYVFAKGDEIDITFISKVKEQDLAGVEVASKASRLINTTYAAHVLGRVGAITQEDVDYYVEKGYPRNAYVGRQGAERAFEDWLHGTSGVREIETSDSGKIVAQRWVTDKDTGEVLEPTPGGNVFLTLDLSLQAQVEDALAAHIQELGHEKGAVAIVDMTGGALALASYPTYDLASYGENAAELEKDPLNPLLNRAASGLYAPGSTFKPLTAVGGLMEGVMTPRDTIVCRGSYTYEGWRNFKQYCHKRSGHGTENLVKAIKDSCNVYFYDIGRRLGIQKLDDYAAQFGLGQHTGIETGDEAGWVAGPATSEHYGQNWNIGSVTQAAIGQENNQATPLQLANYIATLVNGGNHYAVHLLDEVKSHDYGAVLYEYQPELLNTIDIPEQGLAAIKEGMYQVTQNAAIAKYFNNLPVRAGAKTGTAELTAGAENKNTNGLLVVFAPLEDPQIAMCILMEGGTSGSSLASLAYDILDYYFTREDVLTQVPAENTLIR